MIDVKRLIIAVVALLLGATLYAQRGDKGDTNQPLRVARERIPPAPPLTPEEALKTFRVAPGFRVELVASEPLVEAPVAMAFDADGRIWVVEMRGGKWLREPDSNRAQWGLDHDDSGRLLYTSNSDQLRGDLVPSQYLKGHPPGVKLSGIGAKIATDQTVWPSRVNPGVNRGYQA